MIPLRQVLIPIVESGRVVGDMPVEISEQCATCRHWAYALRCVAFPDGIPAAIRTGRRDHRKPFRGDRGIRYEPISGSK